MDSSNLAEPMTLRTTLRRRLRLESAREREKSGRVELTVAHDRLEAIGEQLVAKVRSKFTAVTLIAGFALSVLMLQITSLWEAANVPRLLHFSIGLTVYSLGLFVVALIKLDALTMPKRFWDEVVSEQPSSLPRQAAYYADEDLWAIYSRMVFYWNYCFLLGAALTGAAMLALLYPEASEVSVAMRWRSWRVGVIGTVGSLVTYFLVTFVAWLRFDSLARAND